MPSQTLVAAMAYKKHQLTPEDLLNFLELRIFTDAWEKDLKLGIEDALCALQIALMAKPRGGEVIRGSKGLRKLRFAPDDWPTGKSGAARVLYVYFESFGLILLVYAYRKNDQEDISKDDLRVINQEITRIENELQAGRQID